MIVDGNNNFHSKHPLNVIRYVSSFSTDDNMYFFTDWLAFSSTDGMVCRTMELNQDLVNKQIYSCYIKGENNQTTSSQIKPTLLPSAARVTTCVRLTGLFDPRNFVRLRIICNVKYRKIN